MHILFKRQINEPITINLNIKNWEYKNINSKRSNLLTFYHLLLSKMIANKGLSALGLSMPNFKASASLLTYSLILASDANTQLV